MIDAKGLLKGPHKVEAVGTGKVYTAKDIILAPGAYASYHESIMNMALVVVCLARPLFSLSLAVCESRGLDRRRR